MKHEGWICPKCGRVYAPWVAQCDACLPSLPVVATVNPFFSPTPQWAKPDYVVGDPPPGQEPRVTCGCKDICLGHNKG